MGCRWYLAMTATEFSTYTGPEAVAWMSCHFSLSHKGISNLPQHLPQGSLLILDDSIPFSDHQIERILEELSKNAECNHIDAIILDFQRQWDADMLISQLLENAPCPIAVTERHAQNHNCPVLVCPDLNLPLAQVVKHWTNRPVWLDIAIGMQDFTITESGCQVSPIAPAEGEFPWEDPRSHCRYHIEKGQNNIRFSLMRSPEMLGDILKAAEDAGIQKAVGLYRDFIR